MTLPNKLNQNQLEDLMKKSRKSANMLVAGMTLSGMVLIGGFALDGINARNAYQAVSSAKPIRVENPENARLWDYCKNEHPKGIIEDENLLYACISRLRELNPDYDKNHQPYINGIDIDGDGKVSSKH